MSLDPLQEDVARLALALPEAEDLALAGGGALLAHGLTARPTRDVDLFTPREGEVPRVAAALVGALEERGYAIVVARQAPTYARLEGSAPPGIPGRWRDIAVDLGQDYRMREPVRLGVGAVLHPEELAADKALALFGRAEPRDLADVAALERRYGLERLLELAEEKDTGFRRGLFAEMADRAARQPDELFAELGVGPDELAGLRARAREWGVALGFADPAPREPGRTGGTEGLRAQARDRLRRMTGRDPQGRDDRAPDR